MREVREIISDEESSEDDENKFIWGATQIDLSDMHHAFDDEELSEDLTDEGLDGDGNYYEYALNFGYDEEEAMGVDYVEGGSDEEDEDTPDLFDDEGVPANPDRLNDEDVIRSDQDVDAV